MTKLWNPTRVVSLTFQGLKESAEDEIRYLVEVCSPWNN